MDTLEELLDRHARHPARAVPVDPGRLTGRRPPTRRRPRPSVRRPRCSPGSSSTTTGRHSRWSRPAAGCSSPTRAAGPRAATSRSTSRPSPPGTTAAAAARSTGRSPASKRPHWPRTPTATIWWSGVLADSVKHTVGVSKDLREGVRRSIEVIANDVVARRAAQGLDSAAGGAGAATGRPGPALPVPDPVPALRRGVTRAGRAAGQGARVRAGLQPGPAARARAHRARDAAGPGRHPPLRLAQAAVRAGGRASPRPRAGVQPAACRPVPAAGHRADRRGRSGQLAMQRVLRPLLLTQEGPRQGARLHLLRRPRHQPARRGLRGPDVLHRLLRHRRPLRGGQGRQRGEGLVGRTDRAGRRHRREGLRQGGGSRHGERRPVVHAGARSSSGCPAGSGSSRRPTTPRRCSPASPSDRRWRNCSTRTVERRRPRRSWA